MDKVKQRAGRLGATATHRERYQALVELSKHCDKTFQNRVMKWSTKDILALLKFVRGMKNNDTNS